jgi:hypothetical protein
VRTIGVDPGAGGAVALLVDGVLEGGQGVSSVFKFGKNYGIVIGVATGLSHPLVKITPFDWKRSNGLIGKDKDASRQLAMELWPRHAESFKRKRDDGRAEAALIARAYNIASIKESA